MTELLEAILSRVFPPKFPKLAPGDIASEAEYAEQGTCGPVRRKRYKDGIDRHFKTANEVRA